MDAPRQPAAGSLPYLELKLGSPTQLRTPRFVAMPSGVLLPGVSRKFHFSYTARYLAHWLIQHVWATAQPVIGTRAF